MHNLRRYVLTVFVLCLAPTACGPGGSSGDLRWDAAQEDAARTDEAISEARLAEAIQYLASDALGGRAPGSTGEELTLSYLTEQYAKLGLRPGNPDGTYLQEVPLVGTTVTNKPSLKLKTPRGEIVLDYMKDFMGWTLRKEPVVRVDGADVVFVGYGIVAPEYGWDDYKDVDVSGKIIVMLVGDPPTEDESLFGGPAMTYYGRWTYKFEIAAAKHAAGAIVIHKPAAAGYPWAVVANSWSGEQFDIGRANAGADRCALESWITSAAADRMFHEAGLDLEAAYRDALSPGFRPVSLDVSAGCTLENTFRKIRSYNVVARIDGRDPELKNEYVIYTAHWDHLGTGNPVDGDSIYNGALDNASGVASTLELARAFARHREKLKRSVLIINTTGEESGLLGAAHYAAHPLYPLSRTVALINIDGLNIWGRTSDLVVVGYGFSDLDAYLEKAVRTQQRHLKADAEPEKGYYYRSDHFPFAKKGVPALYADSGVEYVGKPESYGRDVKNKYTAQRYHKPQDEYSASWDLSGAVEDIEALFRVGYMVAVSDHTPEWSEKSEFRQIRKASRQAGR